MLFFWFYAVFLLFLGFGEFRRSHSAAAFFVNGHRSGTAQVCFSLVGASIGSSATIGMAGLAWQVGAPAFWWLGSGALGFAFMACVLARSVRGSGAWTLPEFVEQRLGRAARMLAACIIVPAWILILAAQFTAMGKLTTVLTGFSPDAALAAGAAVLVLYSALGGQASVIRSDLPQGLILLAGLFVGFCWLFSRDAVPLLRLPLELVNEEFGMERAASFLLIMGGSYIAGPTMFSVLLSARDARCAQWGTACASLIVAVSAMLIVGLGVLCRGFVPMGTAPDDVLTMVIGQMPPWAGMAMLAALFSAMLSSADSCLVTAATVLCNDIFRCRRARLCRMSAFGLGLLGWLLAAQGHSILKLMLAACDVCMCGLLGPLLVAFFTRTPSHGKLSALAVAVGGACGLASSVTGSLAFTCLGVILSASMVVADRR